jgi:hypothetical protein
MLPDEYEKVPLNEQEGFERGIAPLNKSSWASHKLLSRGLAAVLVVSLLGNAVAVWQSLHPRIVAVDDFQSPHGQSVLSLVLRFEEGSRCEIVRKLCVYSETIVSKRGRGKPSYLSSVHLC